MKYIISLMFGGLLLTSTLLAQNLANNGPLILHGVPTTSTAEDEALDISSRGLFVMENSMNDYSSTIWARDIYRQISNDGENETFFYPQESTRSEVNLFSLLLNLLSTNTIKVYKYRIEPEMTEDNLLSTKDVLTNNAIPFTEGSNNNFIVRKEDIPSSKIAHYLVKEKWYFDINTGKGDVRVTHICPILFDEGKNIPLFWVRFDDISAYLARAVSPVAVSPASTSNASMFDVIRNRYYKGCVYQVGLRQLSTYFPEMEDLIKERKRIENELDYIQAKFYTAQKRR